MRAVPRGDAGRDPIENEQIRSFARSAYTVLGVMGNAANVQNLKSCRRGCTAAGNQ